MSLPGTADPRGARSARVLLVGPEVHAQARSEPRFTGNDHVFALAREHAGQRVLVIANFSAGSQRVSLAAVPDDAADVDGRSRVRDGDEVVLAPYQYLWISD